jgi:hypothetical protein
MITFESRGLLLAVPLEVLPTLKIVIIDEHEGFTEGRPIARFREVLSSRLTRKAKCVKFLSVIDQQREAISRKQNKCFYLIDTNSVFSVRGEERT